MEHILWAAALAAVAGVAAVLLARERRSAAGLRDRTAELSDAVELRDRELAHLAAVRLPELRESLQNSYVRVSGPLHRRLDAQAPGFARDVQKIMDLFSGSVERVAEHAAQASRSADRSMMRTMQSLANEQQLAISTMQERHDDPDVLEGLLRIDHMNAQIGRRAQAMAVLSGSWPGQQRSASSLSDVVRGATSRIRDYLRVNMQNPVNMAVISRAVEPVVLTVAELLDNAARHSRPDTMVEVNFQTTHNGVAIMIDDAGVAMTPEELRRADERLSGEVPSDVQWLGDPPQVGFAVAGVLAARYGFSVSVDTRSPYGGVRAVVLVPNALLTPVPDAPGAAAAPGPAASRPADAAPSRDAARTGAVTAGGLPKRSRVAVAERDAGRAEEQTSGAADATDAAAPARAAGDGEEPPARPAREIAAGLGAWQRGTRSGRAGASPGEAGATGPGGDPRP
ncbi:ATP-binding protein [Actinomadura algeriensis]|uniref:histidine kinase n=1 Tax=Actinomadura algeriensis TaxID=1679523 RepID=A0ABR9JK40_9ACTN|nr:ATP-binding protein [Actinomadura algeriensis]MBE1530912.1 signal transduction histidine kinase [Actinomadura algeriensis]